MKVEHGETVDESFPSGRWMELTIRGLSEIASAVDAVAAAMAAEGYPRIDLFGVRLALDEAICNAVKHGNRGDATKLVWVRYRIGVDEVLIEVEDQGGGFDPEEVPDPLAAPNRERPSGRGLLLMRQYTTWLCFSERGNCVCLARQRSA